MRFQIVGSMARYMKNESKALGYQIYPRILADLGVWLETLTAQISQLKVKYVQRQRTDYD